MVSVVMASYNGEKYLAEQLDSIRQQTHAPDEVIICDDGSTDNTVKAAKAYFEKHGLNTWKIYRNERNLGYFDNFLKAVSLAKGDTIYLSDQDDVWDLKKVELFEQLYASDSSITMIQSNVRFIDSDGKEIEDKSLYHGKAPSDKPVPLTTEDMCKFAGSGFTMSFKRQVSDTIFKNGFEKKKEIFDFHDVLLGLAAAALGSCVLMTNVVDSHRLHLNNATQKKNKAFYADRTKAEQIRIVANRVKRYELACNICNDTEKKACFTRFSEFAKARKEFIEKFSFSKLRGVIKRGGLYASRLGVITDSMYSLGLERQLMFLYRHM